MTMIGNMPPLSLDMELRSGERPLEDIVIERWSRAIREYYDEQDRLLMHGTGEEPMFMTRAITAREYTPKRRVFALPLRMIGGYVQ
jgi:hypothetical protein